VARGYKVVGVDASESLLELARKELPEVDFRVQDARDLRFEEGFAAVLCTFDSLNHVLDFEGLGRVFAGVHRALAKGGLFVFDMNLEEAYSADLHEWAVTVDEENVTLVRGEFDRIEQKAATELIWFRKRRADGDLWERRRSVVEERCYAKEEIMRGLRSCGFSQIEATAAVEAGMDAQLGYGRYFFSVQR
jgi:SAM-dependent methyltransferase